MNALPITADDFLTFLFSSAIGKPGTIFLSHARRDPAGNLTGWHDTAFDLSRADALTRVAQIARQHAQHEEVYFSCAIFAGEQRREAQAIAFHFLYADLDGGVIAENVPEPTVTLLTSPGRRQCGWLLTDPIDRTCAVDVNRRIAFACGADPSGADATQVLRLPQTFNYKYSDKPLVTVEVWEPSRVYTPQDFAHLALPPAPPSLIGEDGAAAEIPDGQRHNWLKSMAAYLRNTPLNDAAFRAALHAVNETSCKPPSPEKEVDEIADWMLCREAHVPGLSPPVPPFRNTDGAIMATLALTTAAKVTPRPIRWHWKGRIALGKVTVVEGDPGVGKGSITVDLAARTSTGAAMPDDTTSDLDGPADVILISTAEDDAADTIVPRLIEAGADLTRVHLPAEDAADVYTLADIAGLEAKIVETGARVAFIDPITAYLPDGVDPNSDKEIRRHVLRPLKGVAARTGAAIVVVRHLNKSGGTNPIYRGLGSIGFTGAARSVLLAARDPKDPQRCVLAVTKSNAARSAPAMAYRIERGKAWDVSRVIWEGTTDHTAQSLLAPPPDEEEQSALEVAMYFLQIVLRDGRASSEEVIKQARTLGIADRTLMRARTKLKVKAQREGYGAAGIWYLSLPSEQSEPLEKSERPDRQETAEQDADQRWADAILDADWGEEPLPAPDYIRLSRRGYAVTENMTVRAAARIVKARRNGH
jgi:hypothetical protein